MKIALVTDTHLTPGETRLAGNWQAVADWVRRCAPDLVVHLGDITADGYHHVEELTHARAVIGALPVPVRFLPGNHDIGDHPADVGASVDEPVSPARLADYRAIFGPDRWSFATGAWQIIGLNAQLFGSGVADEAEQDAWLEDVLAQASGPLGVMIHKPIRPEGADLGQADNRYLPPAPRRRLAARLAQRDLRFVVVGHTHQALRMVVDSTEHVWVPSAAFIIPDAIHPRIGDKVVGTMMLELDDTGHRLALTAPPGLVAYSLFDFPKIYKSSRRD